MNITIEENTISINSRKISNFIIRKVGENKYEIDNGMNKRIIEVKYRNLIHFKIRTIEQGNFCFYGNTKDMNYLLDSVDAIGFQIANGKFHFSDREI